MSWSAMLRRKLDAHVETWRLYTVCYPGLLAVAAAMVWRKEQLPLATTLIIFAVPTFGWLAALYGCDYLDSEVDAVQKGHRPIPSKRLSHKEAIVAMLGCVYLGLLGSAWLGMSAVLLSGAVMATSIVYGFGKSSPLVGPLSRGLAAALTVLFGYAAGAGGDFRYGWLVLTVFLLHDMTSNLVGEIRDVEGDRQAGCATVAARYGVRTALRLATMLFFAWELVAAGLPILLGLRILPYVAFYGPALALGATAMLALGRRPENRRVALFAHKCFVLERLLLAGALLSAVGTLTAAAFVLPLLTVAYLAQRKLRDRHEFAQAMPQPLEPAIANAPRQEPTR